MANIFDLTGRTALVTGASSGIGAEIAQMLARAGADVRIAARRTAALEGLATQICDAGGRCTTAALDLTDLQSIDALGDLEAIDILVNNAGMARGLPALDHSDDDWDSVINTNLKGMFLMSRAVGRAMRDRGNGGSIINIASILGLRQQTGVLAYAVSKGGVIQLTKSMALDLARYDIRVNAIAPGYFETDINRGMWSTDAGRAMLKRIPTRRLGEFHELEGPILLLASDASSYMNGAIIPVDGGHLVSSL